MQQGHQIARTVRNGGLVSHSPALVSTPFLFNGQYGVMTDATGLYYMRARYYRPD